MTDIQKLVKFCINPNSRESFEGMEANLISVFIVSLLYFIWNYHNFIVHGDRPSLHQVVLQFELFVEDY